MKGKQGETQETPRREEREKRTNKRRSWVFESGTLPPFIGSIHAPAPCARPRKAGRSPRPYPLVPRSVVHAATASWWGSSGHLWRALVLCISCRMRFTLHACSMPHAAGFQPLILDFSRARPVCHPESIIQHMSEQEQRLAVLHLISGLSDGSLGCVDGRSGE